MHQVRPELGRFEQSAEGAGCNSPGQRPGSEFP